MKEIARSVKVCEEIAEKKKRTAQALHPHSAGDGVGLESLAKSYKRFQKTHVYFSLNSIFMPSKTLVRACSLQDLIPRIGTSGEILKAILLLYKKPVEKSQ
jgi:hypothetical protein